MGFNSGFKGLKLKCVGKLIVLGPKLYNILEWFLRRNHTIDSLWGNFFSVCVNIYVMGRACGVCEYFVLCEYLYDGQGMWRVWGRVEVCTGCCWGSLRKRGHWGDQDVDGRIILRWIFRKLEGVVGTGWSWLRIGTGGGHLWVLWGTFGFHKYGEFLD